VKVIKVSRYVKFITSVFFAILFSFLIPDNAFASNLITANSTTTSNGITLYTKWSGDLLLTGCETLTLRPYANDFRSGVLQIIENGSVTQTFSLNNNNVNSVSGIFFNLCSNRSTFENGSISALGQNRNLNIRVSMTTMGRVYSSRYRTTVNEIPVSRTLNTSFVYVVKAPKQITNPAPQQTSNPAPQQTSNPTPQQTSNPTPQQTSNPAPQQTSNPTPQQTSNPTPQPTWTIDSYTPPMPEFTDEKAENKRLFDEAQNALIQEVKQTKILTCRQFNYWSFSNVEPYKQLLTSEMCMDYNAALSYDFRLENIYPGGIDNELTLNTGNLDPRYGEVNIQILFTKNGSKKVQTISKSKMIVEDRRTHHCYFNRKGTFLDTPYNDWDCRMDNTYKNYWSIIKLPKSVGKLVSVGGEVPAKINGKLEIVLTHKQAVGKKKLVYKWNQKLGWFTGGSLG
jgi:hypothetical protein